MKHIRFICALLLSTSSIHAVDRVQAARLIANGALLALAPGAPLPTLGTYAASYMLGGERQQTRSRPDETANEIGAAGDLLFAFNCALISLAVIKARGDSGYWKYQLERGFYKMSFPEVNRPKGKDYDCSICINSFEEGSHSLGPCPVKEKVEEIEVPMHLFHPGCINPWADCSDLCPMCKAKLVGVRSLRSPIDGVRTVINNGGNNVALAIAASSLGVSGIFLSRAILKALDIIDAYPRLRKRKFQEPSRLQKLINILWY